MKSNDSGRPYAKPKTVYDYHYGDPGTYIPFGKDADDPYKKDPRCKHAFDQFHECLMAKKFELEDCHDLQIKIGVCEKEKGIYQERRQRTIKLLQAEGIKPNTKVIPPPQKWSQRF